jgi:hypothetical protein
MSPASGFPGMWLTIRMGSYLVRVGRNLIADGLSLDELECYEATPKSWRALVSVTVWF